MLYYYGIAHCFNMLQSIGCKCLSSRNTGKQNSCFADGINSLNSVNPVNFYSDLHNQFPSKVERMAQISRPAPDIVPAAQIKTFIYGTNRPTKITVESRKQPASM